jgi:Uncharacterised protein family (UPF0158)
MEISDEILKEIAGEMDMGMKCFLNKETLEVVSFPDENKFDDYDDEDWREEIDKVENDPGNFIEIEPMDSKTGYRIMESFIEDLKDEPANERLMQAITGKKPFANFKIQLHEFPELVDQWYAYKENYTIDFIREQLS